MANSKTGFYRDTRTGAIRESRNPLGFPFVEATQAEVDALPGRKPAAKSASSGKASSEDAGKGAG